VPAVGERVRTESILRESDVRHAFLEALGAALRPLADPVEIQATASRVLGEHLGANRVTYFDVHDDHYVIEQDYVRGVASLVGRHPVGTFSNSVLDAFRRGQVVVNGDVAHDVALTPGERANFARMQVAAYIAVPLMKNGRFVVGLCVHSRRPRAWAEEEVALVEETAERIWSAALRARAEAALAQSEARYRTLFNQIDEGFCVAELLYDEAGEPCDRRLIEANARYHAMVGEQFAEGASAHELLPNIDNYWFDRCHEVVTTGSSLRFEHHVPHLDRWYEVYLSRLGGDGSRTYAAVFHETTHRRRREQNLEFLSEVGRDLVALTNVAQTMRVLGERLGRHLQLAGCCFAVVDVGNNLVAMDYEWLRDGVQGIRGEYPLRDFLGEKACAMLEAGREVVSTDVRGDPAVDGDRFAALGVGSFACAPVIADGALRFVLVAWCTGARDWRTDEVDLLRELTGRLWSRLERARADEALRLHQEQSAAELREADRRKDEFLATLGHELRNPLAPIRNGLHYFRRAGVGAGEPEVVLKMMERQFNHLVRLVDDLLEVSRINRGKVELRLSQVDLADIIQGAVETSRPLIEERGHRLTVQQCASPLPLQADAVRMTQVFSNLLNNAARYTPPRGSIELVARREGEEAVVVVRDDGLGIPPAMLGRIFDLFTQVDGSGGRAQGGLGIGLTLVRSIVGLHGGRVEARSPGPGGGSEFIVALPLNPGA
jgi:signal transduction histidine kinase/PAS domain-containing protein